MDVVGAQKQPFVVLGPGGMWGPPVMKDSGNIALVASPEGRMGNRLIFVTPLQTALVYEMPPISQESMEKKARPAIRLPPTQRFCIC